VEGGQSAVASQQRRKRKRKHSSSQNIGGKTSVKTSNSDGHKQESKIGRKRRRNVNKDSVQSAKDHKHSVTDAASLSKKNLRAKKVKRKHEQSM